MSKNIKREYAGVWMDNRNATIISETETGEFTKGETIMAPANFVSTSEKSKNNAKQGDLLKYFKELSNHLNKYDEIIVFGPGQAQEQFQNHLKEEVQFKNKKVTIDSAEHLTDPQMIAFVRDYFHHKS